MCSMKSLLKKILLRRYAVQTGMSICLLFAIVLSACDDLNEIHQKYLDEKPVSYLGIADELTAYGGEGYVKLTWIQNADPRVVKTVIYWNHRDTSVVKDFVRTTPGAQKDSVFIDVPEGIYTFEVVNVDEDGGVSLATEAQGRSYGDVYKGALRFRPLKSIERKDAISGVLISWDTQLDKTRIGTEVKYRNSVTGQWEVFLVRESDLILELPNAGNRLWNPDDIIYFSSLHRPQACIDTLKSQAFAHQCCLYTVAQGKRMEFNASGVHTGTDVNYSDLEKNIWYAAINKKNTLQCNRFGNFGIKATTLIQFYMTIKEDYTVTVNGFENASDGTKTMDFYDSDKSDGKISTFDPETGTLVLYTMRKTIPGGAYTVMEETLIPAIE